jgi:tyrosinase
MVSFFSTFTGLAALLSFLASAQAASNSTNGPSCGVAKADDSYFSVVGVQGTGVHPRQELRELGKDTELWNIFIQAFARFQAMDQSQKISYYQVAGMRVVILTESSTDIARDTRCAIPAVGQRERYSW